MSDVFVSYKAEDRRRVSPLVDALEKDGFSVWWDAHIGGGTSWRDTIEAELDRAACVLVVWSKRSVGADGRFVRDEAARAQRRNVYLPVSLDDVQPPLGFGEVQVLPLVGWRGSRSDQRYERVVNAVRAIVVGAPQPGIPRRKRSLEVDRRVALGGGLAAVGAAAFVGWFVLGRHPNATDESLAVLPFANLSGDPAQVYFSDGLTEDLRTALARLPGLKVIGRVSSEKFRAADDVEAVARQLRVRNVLTGSVRRSPTTVRIATQLIDGSTGVERWSESFDRPLGDAFAIQSEIAQKVAVALSLQLGNRPASTLLVGTTGNSQARDLYFRAVAVRESAHGEDNFRQAITLLDAAIKLDPSFATAYAQKASTLADLTGSFAQTPEDFARGYAEATTIARRSIALAPGLALGHAALADALWGQLNFRAALAEYHRALVLSPDDAGVLMGYSRLAAPLGQTARAIEAARKASDIDPLNPKAHALLANAYFAARRYEDTIAVIKRVLELSPGREPALIQVGDALTLLGRYAEARAAYAKADADDLFTLSGEAILAARTHNASLSDDRLEKIERTFGEAASYQIAQVLAQRGEVDKSMVALDRSLRVRDPGLVSLPTDPFMDPLRKQPRFDVLLRQLDFPVV